jgi:hypothetical protein
MPFTGQRTTGNVAAGQRKIDVSKSILNLDPSETPYTVILKRTREGGNTEKTVNPEFKWAEDQRDLRWDQINNGAGYASGITSIVVDNGPRFYPGALVKVPRTGETMRVTAVSTNTLTVVRGFSGSTAAAIVDDDPLLVLGYAADEGSRAPAVRSENPSFVTNYTQIFKKTLGASGTWRSSENETMPHDWDHQRAKAHVEHMLDIENAGLFGKPSEIAGTDGPLRTTGGVLHYLTSNAQAIGGTLTEAVFDAWCADKAFKDGSDEKVLFASSFLISVLSGFAKAKMNTTVAQNKYGVNYTDYVTPFGTLSIVRHRLLEGAVYGKMGFVVDFKRGGIKYRYLAGGPGGSRDTHVKQNRQETDRDGQVDELLTEAGFQVGLPATGATITGVTG